MDDSLFSPNNIFGNPSELMMDFDYVDELLFDGCWLQATDGSEFINNNNPLFDPSYQWPTLEFNNGDQLPEDVQEERQRSSFLTNLSVSQTEEGNPSKSHISNSIGFYNQSESSDTSRRWWIPPMATIGRHSLSVKERLIHAIDSIKDSTMHKNVLIQIWLPENREGKKVLSTSHQLSSLDSGCPQLSNYRNISENYHFAAEGDSKEVGLPGRVYMGKVPEWTPDVRFFKTEEYPRVEYAQQLDVRGSVAVPIFDHDRQSCLGVIEVVMTTQKSNYAPEIERVCKALEVGDGLNQAALPEILEILKSACETHNLPLAQTWVPCIQQGKGGCRHSAANVIHCISTVDSACYVNDPAFKDFQEACSEHHLLKGQGVVGQAFTTNQPCYFPDIASYRKTDYPLSHHARIFNLCGVVAIRLRSTFTENIDYVLEFFLPVDCKEPEEQKALLNSLSIIIQNVCRSLRIVTDKELVEEGSVVSGIEAVKVEEISQETPVDLIGTQVRESGSGDGVFGNDGGNKRPPERRRGGAKTEKTITLEMLRQYFAGSLKDAAKNLGVCPTTLKRICRQHGIQRWPSRKIKKVGHSLQKIQLVMDSVHGASGSFQIESFYSNFPKLASSDPKTSSFSASKFHNVDSKPIEGLVKSSLSPSCSQTSSSGQSCSSGTHPYPHPRTPTAEDSGNCGLKRARSDAELHVSLYSEDQEQKVLQRSHSHKSLTELPITPKLPPKGEHVQRVKVTYGEEKIRFRLQKDWGYGHLLQEIAKRFCINDMNEYHLKYFDDDSEWVLLTCDADLEECIDVYRLCQNATIKLALFEPQLVAGSLGSTVVL
ncbi:Phox/Bem1p [Cynara cardunculus var. scolymus]|uniref:Phox/Bem1p n=1 Tax=Cynara cardunculus var. scolymus TaxID=59895 RepID=A0A118K4L8_CYNCS|nr:Phox/Bem1p [Cynara cardunculus var. scolymus]